MVAASRNVLRLLRTRAQGMRTCSPAAARRGVANEGPLGVIDARMGGGIIPEAEIKRRRPYKPDGAKDGEHMPPADMLDQIRRQDRRHSAAEHRRERDCAAGKAAIFRRD